MTYHETKQNQKNTKTATGGLVSETKRPIGKKFDASRMVNAFLPLAHIWATTYQMVRATDTASILCLLPVNPKNK